MEKLLETKSKLRLEKDEVALEREFKNLQGSHSVKNQIKQAVNISYKGISKDKDKSDFSVVEKVIDQKTERLFAKWEKNGVISKIQGCISTGKEANVYHALSPDGKELAIKIYKVETMVFRDREEYIEGEHRFKKGYQRTNPYKLIKVWAEKEFRNLKRIKAAGLFCPTPLIIRENLIVMEFVGKNGKAAPRLKDVKMNQKQHSQAYLDLIELVKTLWQKCNLVHGDLSPYNVLFENDCLILIDVSQSVGDDHPLALEFLKRDLRNLNHYYRQQGVQTFHLRDLFDYVRNKKLSDPTEKTTRIEQMMSKAVSHQETEEEELAFLLTEIPKSLAEIPPDELEKVLDRCKGDWEMVAREYGLEDRFSEEEDNSGEEEDDDESSGEEENEDLIEEPIVRLEENLGDDDKKETTEDIDENPDIADIPVETNQKSLQIEATFDGPLKFMDESLVVVPELTPAEEEEKKARVDPFEGMSKQERKKKVKEENRVRRQNKMPKKEKKRLIKKSKH